MGDVYIVGVGRSGTSLLQSMLHAHSVLTSTPESHFFRSYLSSDKKQSAYERKGSEHFKEVLKKDRYFNRLGIDPEGLTSLSDPSFSVLEVYQEINDRIKSSKGKEILVDKDPRNLENISRIHHHFPSARIAHIIRDPRDVIYSKTKANWSSGKPYWLHAMIGEAQMEKGLQSAKSLDAQTYYQLKYEDLLEVPEDILKGITAFIGISYEPQMLNFTTAAQELVTKEEMQWKKETLQPLKKGNRYKWKDLYSPYQLAVIERISNRTMDRFGYQYLASGSDLSLWHKVKLSAASLASAVFSILYSWLK